MKLTTIIIILLILLILFSSVNEGFILTDVLPSNLSITLTKGLQTITATVGNGFTTDPNVLDGNTYYAVGTLNDAGKKAVADANLIVKNNGTTCNQFPSNLYIKLPATDAVCKTTDVDLYDVPSDSFSTCTKNINGILYKSGKLKTPDSAITIQDGYNGGKTCTQLLPATKDIACGGIDAVCKTTDIDLYDIPADSNTVCTILENGISKKQGTLKTDSSITVTAKIGTGKTCTQLLPATKNINCGPINAVCPINDNTFYTFNPTIVKGSDIVVPPPSISSVTTNMSTTTTPDIFTATIKVIPPSSYSSLGIVNYNIKIIDTFNNFKVNRTDVVTIDSSNNLKVDVVHVRQVNPSSYLATSGIFNSDGFIKDQFNFNGNYKVTISGITQAGSIGNPSAEFTFSSGLPNITVINQLIAADQASRPVYD
jgi:hypothetical protein